MKTTPTATELAQLDRLARKMEPHLKFLRDTPRNQKDIPFVEDKPTPKARDAAICAALAALAWLAIWRLA